MKTRSYEGLVFKIIQADRAPFFHRTSCVRSSRVVLSSHMLSHARQCHARQLRVRSREKIKTSARKSTSCNGISFIIPYLIFPNDSSQPPSTFTGRKDNHIRIWIHVSLLCFGLLIGIVNFFAQWFKPLPYGKLSQSESRCNIPTRLAHIASHFIPGFIVFTIAYFTGLHFNSPVNISMYILFSIHYISRGILTPGTVRTRYSSMGTAADFVAEHSLSLR